MIHHESSDERESDGPACGPRSSNVRRKPWMRSIRAKQRGQDRRSVGPEQLLEQHGASASPSAGLDEQNQRASRRHRVAARAELQRLASQHERFGILRSHGMPCNDFTAA